MTAPVFFILRVRRDGPLVPARLWLCDHDPADPSNKLDRGRLSIFPRAEVAGREIDPERMFDRLMSPSDWRPGVAETHWKYPQPIPEAEYRYRLAHLDWTRKHRPGDPRGSANDRIKPAELPLEGFSRERGLVG